MVKGIYPALHYRLLVVGRIVFSSTRFRQRRNEQLIQLAGGHQAVIFRYEPGIPGAQPKIGRQITFLIRIPRIGYFRTQVTQHRAKRPAVNTLMSAGIIQSQIAGESIPGFIADVTDRTVAHQV